MAATYIMASGKITGGSLTMRIALPPIQTPSRTDLLLAAIAAGRRLYETGASRSQCRNQDEEAGWDAAAVADAASSDAVGSGSMPVDGFLQATIDYAAELEMLQDGMEDNIWHSRGGW